MSAPVLDERVHATALLDAIGAQLDGSDVYEYGDVPGLDNNPGREPEIYVLVAVERRFTPAAHSPRLHTRSSWRVSTRAVGTTVNEARWASLRVARALDGVRLDVDGHTSTPVAHESSTAPEFDKGRAHALTLWTYTL